jgi:hypothetical protein
MPRHDGDRDRVNRWLFPRTRKLYDRRTQNHALGAK